MPRSRYHGREAIICDGAVRSGKTLSMGLGFFLWAMACFDGRRFGLCGKTVSALPAMCSRSWCRICRRWAFR